MQEYIEDYAKFLCMEENEGTLFYFLSNRDRNIAVRRGPEYSRIETARIYIPTNGKEHNKILSKLGLVYRKSHKSNYVMFDFPLL